MVSAPVGLSDLLISLTGELCLSSDCQGARVATRRAGGGRGEVVGCGRTRREKKVVLSADRAYFLSTVSGR